MTSDSEKTQKGRTMSDQISTAALIENARGNAVFGPNMDEGGAFTDVTLDADLFELLLTRLAQHAAGG